MTWRAQAAPIISKVLAECREQEATLKETRAALRKAYPFGEKSHYPYKTWLDEIHKQLAPKPQPQPQPLINWMKEKGI